MVSIVKDKITIYLFGVIVVLLSSCSCFEDPATPVWPAQFTEDFTETMTYPVIGSSKTKGQFYYDWTNKRYRVDRENGKWDRYCGSVYKFSDTPCQHYVVEGKRYLNFPKKDYCCYCCDSAHGCGILKPDWLAGAIFEGEKTDANGITYNVWNKKGLQNNYYWATKDQNILARIDQQPNDIQEFDVSTYKVTIDNPSIFDLPSKCSANVKCPIISVCTALRFLN